MLNKKPPCSTRGWFPLPLCFKPTAPGDIYNPLILQHSNFKEKGFAHRVAKQHSFPRGSCFILDIDKGLVREAIVQPIIASTWSSSPWQGYQSFQQIIHKSVLWLLQVLRIIGESMKEYQKVRKSPSNYCIGWWYSRQGVRVYYCSASASTPTADRGTEGVHGISTLCVFVCLHQQKDLRSTFWVRELKPLDILWEYFVHFVCIGSNRFCIVLSKLCFCFWLLNSSHAGEGEVKSQLWIFSVPLLLRYRFSCSQCT